MQRVSILTIRCGFIIAPGRLGSCAPTTLSMADYRGHTIRYQAYAGGRPIGLKPGGCKNDR